MGCDGLTPWSAGGGSLVAGTSASRPAHVHRPTLTLPSLVDCCFFTPPVDGGGRLGASSAPPIQRTCPTPPRRRSKIESPGLRSCGHRDGYPCARERPSLAISMMACARRGSYLPIHYAGRLRQWRRRRRLRRRRRRRRRRRQRR